jgi:hypothetical protein
MTFYPTDVFIENYHTHLPIIVACCGVLLILLVSLVFVGFDLTVWGVVAHKEIVLDTKRRFVRFVSHEIRTPMNAVRLGMTLFSTEIDSLVGKMEGKSLEEVMGVLQTIVADWRQIAVDVLDNCEAAVDVLNDLLNYDKVVQSATHPLTLLLSTNPLPLSPSNSISPSLSPSLPPTFTAPLPLTLYPLPLTPLPFTPYPFSDRVWLAAAGAIDGACVEGNTAHLRDLRAAGEGEGDRVPAAGGDVRRRRVSATGGGGPGEAAHTGRRYSHRTGGTLLF